MNSKLEGSWSIKGDFREACLPTVRDIHNMTARIHNKLKLLGIRCRISSNQFLNLEASCHWIYPYIMQVDILWIRLCTPTCDRDFSDSIVDFIAFVIKLW